MMIDAYTIAVACPSDLDRARSHEKSMEINAWLTENFGERDGTEQDRWRVRYQEYRFKYQSDAMLFALRWT